MKRKLYRWLLAGLMIAVGIILVAFFCIEAIRVEALIDSATKLAKTDAEFYSIMKTPRPSFAYWVTGWGLIGAGLFSLFPRPLMGAIIGAAMFAILSWGIPLMWYLTHWTPLL